MDNQSIDINNITKSEVYIPSSVERKRALLMYFLIGIIMSIWRTDMAEFEIYHMKQSIWFWLVAIIIIWCAGIFILIPYMWIVGFIMILFVLGLFVVFVREVMLSNFEKEKASKGKLFYWLGNRAFELFYS